MLPLLAALLAAPAAQATPKEATPSVATLLDGFRTLKSMQAHFREEKQLAMLATPLVSEGELYFLAPNHLRRDTVTPSPATLSIDGNTLSFGDGHESHSLSLDQNPVARLFVDSFLKVLTGDLAGLQQVYALTMAPAKAGQQKSAWTLVMTPKTDPMNKLIAGIDVHGRGLVLDELRVREVSGDETVTRFSAVDTARHFTAEERARLFHESGP